MAQTIYDTVVSYLESCRGLNSSPNDFILETLQKIKEEAMLDDSDTQHLKFCANNKLTNQKNIKLGDLDGQLLYLTLKTNNFITVLDLRYNCIGDVGASWLAKLLEENEHLTELNVMFNSFEEDGAAAIARSLHENKTLLYLNLAGNKIGNKGGMYFAEALQINSTLRELDLGDCDLKIDSIIALATVLNHNTSLVSLNVNRPLLWTQQEETTVHMAEMLVRNNTLKSLHLSKYELRDFGAARVADALVENRSLTTIDLSCNRITRDGAQLLANVLFLNTPLTVLDLAYNRLEDDGACHIAKAILGMNTRLKVLVVKFNEIKGGGLCALAESLKFNSTLTHIYIWGNQLDDSACVAFAELLRTQRLLEANTDVRAYEVDGKECLCQVNHDVDYRQFRYTAPVYGDNMPQDRKFALR